MTNAMIDRNEARLTEARRRLTPEQIQYAEWMAIPSYERVPKTKKEFAEGIGVSYGTLRNWEMVPEVWTIRDEILRAIGKDLVPEAVRVLRKAMYSPDSKVALQAAKDILDRWAEPRRQANIVASITDMYKQLNE